MKINRTYFALFLLITLSLFACQEDEEMTNPCDIDFSQKALLNNIANNILLPAYENHLDELNSLIFTLQSAFDEESISFLNSAQQRFTTVYETWQYIEPYNFGPAEANFLREVANPFPLNLEDLLANMAAGPYTSGQFDRFDKGYPAVDYLLFGVADTQEETLAYYADPAKQAYLLDLLEDIRTRLQTTIDEWNNGYFESFTNNTGTAAGTSVSLLINNINEHYENIKRDRIGIPSGVLTLDFPNPDKVEAPYSQLSQYLAVHSVLASQEFFTGRDLVGLDDYLEAAEATKNGDPLEQLIIDQYASALAALEKIPVPLKETVVNQPDLVSDAYTELVKNVVQLKTDMPSVLCVAITYIDNPSDSD